MATTAQESTFADLFKNWTGIEVCLGLNELEKPSLGAWAKMKESAGMKPPPRVVKTPCGMLDIAAARNNVRRYWLAWNPYRFAWLRGEKDVTALSSQVSNFRQAQLEMEAAGADVTALTKAAPDIEDGHAVAVAIDNAAKAMGVPASVLGPGAGALGVNLAMLPPWAKALGLGAAGVLAFALLSNVVAIARVAK